jgi:hypothetical protein
LDSFLSGSGRNSVYKEDMIIISQANLLSVLFCSQPSILRQTFESGLNNHFGFKITWAKGTEKYPK